MDKHLQRAGRICAVAGLLLFVAGCGGGSNSAALPSLAQMKSVCAGLVGKTLEGVTVAEAVRIEPTPGVHEAGLCKISGTRAPYLDIEVTVPDNWSGRLYQQGGGGFDGRVASAVTSSGGTVTAVHAAVAQRGAVYAASNGGNRAAVPGQAAPAVWISGSADAKASATDYAYAALGTTVLFAKAVTTSFFARGPAYTYFNGCSNGGRNAYIAAERWPAEYDGVISGCESMDMGGTITALLNTAAKAGTPAEIAPAQYADAYARAVSSCDAADGVSDGYLANPTGCNFNPAALQCGQASASTNAALCLSPAQVATLAGLLSDLKLSSGTTIYSRYSWTNFAPTTASPGVPPLGVTSYGGLGGGFALLATNDPRWLGAPPPATTPASNLATFNLDQSYTLISEGLLLVGADHRKSAIASYVASGRKLLSWHDAGDPLISANDHMRNFATMTGIAKVRGLADPRANARLMLVPASTHGAGGTLAEVDWLVAMIDWVEQGRAPDQLTYRFSSGATARTLPVCEAPGYPRYKGTGDVNSAGSYTCTQ